MSFFGAQWASTLVELPTLTFHQAILPLSIFSALHGIRVSMAYRQAIEQAAAQSLRDGKDPQPTRLPWGQALLSVLAMSLGGGFSASTCLFSPFVPFDPFVFDNFYHASSLFLCGLVLCTSIYITKKKCS
jgi:hypothetical protein